MKNFSSNIIATAAQCQQVDSDTSNNFGVDEFTLMEVAGHSVAQKIRAEIDLPCHAVILCGRGNNGGDGLVVGRYLVQHGVQISIVFVGGVDDLSPMAQKNYELLQKIERHDDSVDLDIVTQWDDFDQSTSAHFIIDGMLGTGLESDLRGHYPAAVRWANKQPCPVFAMDIPTGLHTDSGEVMGAAVQADKTFAFGMLKQGFYLGQGHKHTGKIQYCELPFPNYLKKNIKRFVIDDSMISETEHTPAAHKYDAGVVYIIAGSEGLTGAAILAAKSAWSAGAGAVILVCPHGLLPIFENNLPQIIKKPVGNSDDFHFKQDHLEAVSKIIREKEGTVLIGPGMGRAKTTVEFVNRFLADTHRECIIDADALWALAQNPQWTKPKGASWIITPHPGELSNLTAKNMERDLERLSEVEQLSDEKELTVLSKGFPVILCSPQGDTFITNYDTRAFSRAGFGDVLAGKIAALKAKGYTEDESCSKALLEGHHQLIQSREKNLARLPEPFDLL
jgi:NAD(P)H-hydrate epimerase